MRMSHKSNRNSFNESNSKRKEVIFYDSSSLTKSCSITTNTFNKHERNYKMKDIKDMNKTELIELATTQQELNKEMHTALIDKDHSIIELQLKLDASSKDGRKSQVLELLRENTTISILEISSRLSISTKNVSSQLTYLRSDGYQIFTDPNGRKCLFEDKTNIIHSVNEDDSINEDDLEALVDSADSDEPID